MPARTRSRPVLLTAGRNAVRLTAIGRAAGPSSTRCCVKDVHVTPEREKWN